MLELIANVKLTMLSIILILGVICIAILMINIMLMDVADLIDDYKCRRNKKEANYKKAFQDFRKLIYIGWHNNPKDSISFEGLKIIINNIETAAIKWK